jgi:hypothetical protein
MHDPVGNKSPPGRIPNISRVLKLTNHARPGMFPLPSSFQNNLHHLQAQRDRSNLTFADKSPTSDLAHISSTPHVNGDAI